MFGFKRKLASLPWPTRILVSLPLVAVFAWVSMRLTASIWVSNVADAISEGNEVEYDSSFFRLNGDFGATNVRLKHYLTEEGEGPTYVADRVVFNTPGLHWLWWGALHEPKNMPDSFGVTMENVRDLARTDQTPGNYTNLPYDQIGCGGTKLLTIEQLHVMGLSDVRRDISLTLKRKDDSLSTLTLDLLTHGAGELTMNMVVTVARPLPWKESLLRFFAAKLQAASVTMKDQGFIAVRNAAFDAQTLARYGPFSEHCGELVLRGTHLPQMELPEFLAMDSGEKLQRLSSALSYNDGPEAPFHFVELVAGSNAAPRPTAIPAPAPAPATATANVPPSSIAPPSAPRHSASVAAGSPPTGAVTYAGLKGREGAHVEILTKNDTLRRGTLINYSAYLSTLKLDRDQGGFTLSVPENSVLEVHLLPTQAGQAHGVEPVLMRAAVAPAGPLVRRGKS